MDGFENKNPYAILGLEQGHLASAEDIRKVRRPASLCGVLWLWNRLHRLAVRSVAKCGPARPILTALKPVGAPRRPTRRWPC